MTIGAFLGNLYFPGQTLQLLPGYPSLLEKTNGETVSLLLVTAGSHSTH